MNTENKSITWTVTIISDWRTVDFDFNDDSEAVYFANMAASAHRSDRKIFSVRVHATFADETENKEETV